MNRMCWWLVERLSQRLEPGERDAVLGDIAESGESGREALRDLLSLAVRRQAALWGGTRTWIALAGLIAPAAVLAGGASGWVGRQFQTILTQGVMAESGMTPADNIVRLVCGILLMIAWAGTAGFILSSLLRRSALGGRRSHIKCGVTEEAWAGNWCGRRTRCRFSRSCGSLEF
jgi:hypothetical protein